MTIVGAPLGILASLSMSASVCCQIMPASPTEPHHRHGQEEPSKGPDLPGGCHAVLGCGAYRKLRTIA